ncbi:MAG: hypothetical protein WCF65_01375 [Parachlamydiaceae bacterium]
MADFQEQSDSSFTIIVCTVAFLHAAFIGYAVWIGPSPASPKHPPPPPRFVVQTVNISPQPKFISMSAPEPVRVSEPALEHTPEPEPSPVPIQPAVDEAPPVPLPPPIQPEPAELPPKKPVVSKKEPAKPQAPEKPKPKTPAAPQKTEPKTPPIPKKTDPPKKATEKSNQQVVADQKRKQDAAAQKKKETEAQKKKVEEDQQAENTRQQKLLSQAQERIAKISKSGDKISPSRLSDTDVAVNPKAITSLQIDGLPSIQGNSKLNDREIGYRDEISSRLKLALRLPEYGDVKVKLVLGRTGKVISVVIVSSESVANRKYIEKALPELSFPSFGTNFGTETQYAISITLSNEL